VTKAIQETEDEPLIISHTHKYIFLKSLKTAGTSVEAALSKHCGANDMVTPLGDYWFNRDERGQWVHSAMNAEGFFQHDSAAEIRRKVPEEIWRDYFKFSIARNPWDRVVSDFSWQARNRPDLQTRPGRLHRLGLPFDELAETRKIFGTFVHGEWKTNDRFYVANGELCVDFVIRFEQLADDLAKVCRRIGLPPLTLPHLKSGLRKDGRSYRDYYGEATRAIVAERHHNDIRLFGYTF
jgi:hypothetical protein